MRRQTGTQLTIAAVILASATFPALAHPANAAACDPERAPSASTVLGTDQKEALVSRLRSGMTSRSTDFAGLTWDGCTRELVVHYKSGRDAKLLKRRLGLGSETVRFKAVRHSDQELQSVFDWMVDQSPTGGRDWLRSHGADLMSAGIDTDRNQLMVGVQNLTPAIAADMRRRFGDSVSLFEDVPGHAQSRTNDSSPFYQGIPINVDLSPSTTTMVPCTAGIVVWDALDHTITRSLTAGHCPDSNGDDIKHPLTGGVTIARTEIRLFGGSQARDQALLRPVAGNSFGGRLWNSNTSSIPVAGWSTGVNGDSVRLSGGASGTVTGIIISDPTRTQCVNLDGTVTCNLISYRKPSGTTWSAFSKPGDSGGVVYSTRTVGSTTQAIVRGMHIGLKRITADNGYAGYYMRYDQAIAPFNSDYGGLWTLKLGT